MKQEKKTSFEGDAILMKREIPCFHGVFQVLFCKIHSGRRQEPKDKGSIMGHLMSTYILWWPYASLKLWPFPPN